jgi:ParB/RepB/Spo0J family partition protein
MAVAKTEVKALPKEHLPLRIERKLVRSNQFNPRTKYDREDLTDLLPNIAANGVKDPLLVRPVPEDDEGHIYEVVDGDRRLRAATELKIAKFDVWVKNMTDAEVMRDGTIFNFFRRNIGPVEVGRQLSALWKLPEYEMMSMTKYAHTMGFSKGDASRLMALPDGLDPEIQDKVAPEKKGRIPEGSIDGRTAYYLTRLPKGERQIEVSDAVAAIPKLRGDRVSKVVEEAKLHPEEPATEIVQKFLKRDEQLNKPTITMSIDDYEKIEKGTKTTVIVRGSAVQPGVRANVEVTPLVRGKPRKVSDIYRRALAKFKDRDAERDGYSNLEELKAAWTERYGDWPDDEVVSIIQFYSAEQLKSGT